MKFIVARTNTTRDSQLDVGEREGSVLEAYCAGFSACVASAAADHDMIKAVRELSAGKSYLSPELSTALLQAAGSGDRGSSAGLSPVQYEVLLGVARDIPPAELAVQMGLPLTRIEEERRGLLALLGVSGIGGLLRHAVRTGACKPCA